MSSIFPIRDTVTRDETQTPRLVDLDEKTADEVFEALASQTTRQIFLALHEQPQTASDLAEETDTSVQNVQYHLEKLTDIEIVEVADTWYSERGSEMKVYAPADESLVLYAGRDKQTSFRSLLKRFTGVFSILVPGAALAGLLASRSDSGGESAGAGAESINATGGGQLDVATESDPSQYETTAQPTTEDEAAADSGADAGDNVEVAEESGGDSMSADADFESATSLFDLLPDADIFLRGNTSGDAILITDGGNATRVSNETLQTTAQSSSGLDPALAAALAFLLGGVVVALSLWAYYGLPE